MSLAFRPHISSLETVTSSMCTDLGSSVRDAMRLTRVGHIHAHTSQDGSWQSKKRTRWPALGPELAEIIPNTHDELGQSDELQIPAFLSSGKPRLSFIRLW